MIKLPGKNYWKTVLAVLLISGGVLAGCDAEEPCIPSRGVIGLGFFAFNENGAREAESFNFVEVEAIGTDSIFFRQNPAGVSTMGLVLDPSSDTTTFVFTYDGGADTLSVAYERRFNVISPECGLGVSFSALEVLAHTFDSVNVALAEVAPTGGVNLEIYRLEPCVDLTTNRFSAGFFAVSEQGIKEARAFNFDTVRAAGARGVFFVRNGTGITGLELALNPAANTTTFLFENRELTDTLSVAYQRDIYVGLPECGSDTLYTGLAVTRSTFDSVSLLTTQLSKTAEGFAIEIYP